MKLKRRTLLQATSLALASLGLEDLLGLLWSDRNPNALAASIEGSLDQTLFIDRSDANHQWERVRLLPTQFSLTLALDSRLDKIEQIDATGAFADIAEVKLVSSEDGVDYVFGRIPESTLISLGVFEPSFQDFQILEGGIASVVCYGLLGPGGDVLPKTIGPSPEAVKTAVGRLAPFFRSLLALKILHLLDNQATTRLPITVTVRDVNNGALLINSNTSPWLSRSKRLAADTIANNTIGQLTPVSLTGGQAIRYQPGNGGDRPLYTLVLIYQPDGTLWIGYPPELNQGDQQPPLAWQINPDTLHAGLIESGESGESDNENLFEGKEQGLEQIEQTLSLSWALPAFTEQTEVFCIFSIAPLSNTLQALASFWSNDADSIVKLDDPLPIVTALTVDLGQASSEHLANLDLLDLTEGISSDTLVLAHSAWAGVRFSY